MMERGSPTVVGTPVLRVANTALVLQHVRDAAPLGVRIADLMETTGLARPTVSQAVAQLVSSALVVEEPEPRDAVRLGRPAQVYRLNPLAVPVLGVDIGTHSVAVAVADATGEMLALKRRPVPRRRVSSMADALDQAVHEALGAGGVTAPQIEAITVATPGILSPTTGEILLIPAIAGWRSFNITRHLQATFDCPIALENDANASAVAVAATSAELGRPLLVVHWGERIGAGILMTAGLHQGAHRAAGEIGLINATVTSKLGSSEGRLQDVISTTAIGRLAVEGAKSAPKGTLAKLLAAARPGDHPGVLFAAAAQQDPVASEVVGALVTTFCEALAPVILALDPQSLVISGGITRAGTILSHAIEEKLAELTLTRCPVHLSADSENTVIKGATNLALQAAWNALDVGRL